MSPSPARVEAEKDPCLSEQVVPTHPPPKSDLEAGPRGAPGTSGLRPCLKGFLRSVQVAEVSARWLCPTPLLRKVCLALSKLNVKIVM